MIYGYVRVSSQSKSNKNSLEFQLAELTQQYPSITIFQDEQISNKPKLNELISQLETGDKFVITKFDRIAKNTIELIGIIEELLIKDVSIHVLNVGLIENASMGKFLLSTLSAIYEMETNSLMEKVRTGKEAAKQIEGYKEGRHKIYSKELLNHALSLLNVNDGKYSYNQVSKLLNISKSTLVRAQKERR